MIAVNVVVSDRFLRDNKMPIVLEELEKIGFKVLMSYASLGMISGFIAPDQFVALKNIEGVSEAEEIQPPVNIAPPESDVQ